MILYRKGWIEVKKSLIFCLAFICLFMFFSIVVEAHSGKTDSNGGHYDSSTGKYHYHHGYSAHQHKNGVCPYDNDNKSESDNTPSSDKDTTVEYINSIKKLDFEEIWVAILCLVPISFLVYFFSIIIFNLFLKIPYFAQKEEEWFNEDKLIIIYNSLILFVIFVFLCITSNLSFKNIFLTIWDVLLFVLKAAPILLVAAIPTAFFCAETKSITKKILVYILMCILLTIFIILFNT